MAIFDMRNVRFCSVPIPPINAHKGGSFEYTQQQIEKYTQSQTHPSIIYSPDKFGGHDFWLASTPYPSGVGVFENPCVYYADFDADGKPPVAFTPIAGSASGNYSITSNPVVKVPNSSVINSDPDLLMIGSEMYLLSRHNNSGHNTLMQKSANGQAWTERTTVPLFGGDPEKISPAFVYKNGYIYAYCITGQAGTYAYDPVLNRGRFTGIKVLRGTSFENGGNFVEYKKADLAGARERIQPWHFDVFTYGSKTYMIMCAKDLERSKTSIDMQIYLAESFDGLNFRLFRTPLFDACKTYRPTACVDSNGNFIMYLCTISANVSAEELPNGSADISPDGRYIGMATMNFQALLNELNAKQV